MVLPSRPLARRKYDSQADTFVSSTSPPVSRRTLEPVTRTNPTSSRPPSPEIVYAPGSSTYTQITYRYPIHSSEEGTDPLKILYDAGIGVARHLAANGDSLISGAMYFEQHGLTLHVENANNHQLTWGVLGAAVKTLQ